MCTARHLAVVFTPQNLNLNFAPQRGCHWATDLHNTAVAQTVATPRHLIFLVHVDQVYLCTLWASFWIKTGSSLLATTRYKKLVWGLVYSAACLGFRTGEFISDKCILVEYATYVKVRQGHDHLVYMQFSIYFYITLHNETIQKTDLLKCLHIPTYFRIMTTV